MKSIFFFNLIGIGADTGVETYCREVTKYFQQKKIKNLIFYSININCDNSSEYDCIEKDGVVFINIPTPIANLNGKMGNHEDETFAKVVSRLLTKRIKNASDIIIHINWIGHSVLAGALKKEFNCKTILTRHCIPWKSMVHTDYEKFYLFQTKSFFKDLSTDCISNEQSGYIHIDKFITVTKCSKSDLIENYQIPNSSISVIRNGVPYTENNITNRRTRIQLRKKYNVSSNEKLLIYVGRNEKNVGLKWIIQCLRLIMEEKKHPVRLMVIGRINPEEIITNNADIMSCISIMGFLEREILNEIYQIGDVGIIPSVYEQCSYTAIEMMKSKLLILASEVDGLAEMIKNNYNGLTFQIDFQANNMVSDIIDMKTKILYAINPKNKISIQRMICNSYELTKRKYNTNRTGSKILKLYKEI